MSDDQNKIRREIYIENLQELLEETRQDIITKGFNILENVRKKRERFKKSWGYRIFGRFFPTTTIEIDELPRLGLMGYEGE